MSYDFSTKLMPCSHEQSFERYVVDYKDFSTLHLAANTSLNMRAPINGQSLVRLYIRGKLVSSNDRVYGYSISTDTNRLQTTDAFYKIKFNRPVRSYIPLIEVSYLTLAPYCMKCGGQGQLNDYHKVANGGIQRVVGTDKLVQRVLKMILTSRCPYYPAFTCKIRDYIGKKWGVQITDADVTNEIINSLSNLKQIQSAQKTVHRLDPAEMLKDVTDIITATPDPTSVSVSAQISSYATSSNQTVPVSFSITTTRQLVGN